MDHIIERKHDELRGESTLQVIKGCDGYGEGASVDKWPLRFSFIGAKCSDVPLPSYVARENAHFIRQVKTISVFTRK